VEELASHRQQEQGDDRDVSFVVFSDDWGRHPSSCEHIFRRIVGTHRVVWVNTMGFRAPNFSLADLRRSANKIQSWFRKPDATVAEPLPPNLEVFSPLILPFPGNRACDSFNARSMANPVKHALQKFAGDDVRLVTSLPNLGGVFRQFPNLRRYYYCVDDFLQWPGANPAVVGAMESELIEHCDAAIVTARSLQDKFDRSPIEPEYLGHGVDCGHFDGLARERAADRPLIGFFGEVRDWFASDLIEAAATQHPDWDFEIIGRIQIDVSVLEALPNVRFTGPVPYPDLPRAAARFDVGLIPYRLTSLTRAINPLKGLEYLALGLPVVATPLPALDDLGDLILRADEPGSFVNAIERALADDGPGLREKRLACARGHDWEEVAGRFLELVGEGAPA